MLAALDRFAELGFDDVGVSDLCTAAGVTTGSLYHHFGSKLGLYDVVRSDVERRVLDRLEGAVAARADDAPAAAAHAALLVAFDVVIEQGFLRLLAEANPTDRSIRSSATSPAPPAVTACRSAHSWSPHGAPRSGRWSTVCPLIGPERPWSRSASRRSSVRRVSDSLHTALTRRWCSSASAGWRS